MGDGYWHKLVSVGGSERWRFTVGSWKAYVYHTPGGRFRWFICGNGSDNVAEGHQLELDSAQTYGKYVLQACLAVNYKKTP